MPYVVPIASGLKRAVLRCVLCGRLLLDDLHKFGAPSTLAEIHKSLLKMKPSLVTVLGGPARAPWSYRHKTPLSGQARVIRSCREVLFYGDFTFLNQEQAERL